MFAKFRSVILLSALIFVFSAGLSAAENEKRPGFHGWGDSQEATTDRVAPESQPDQVTKTPERAQKAEKAEAERPKAEKERTAESRERDRIREKIRKEGKAFYEDTKSLRQEIYQKRLELRSELAKKKPSERRAKAIHKEIVKMRAKLDEKRLAHFLKLKKMDPEMNWRRYRGEDGYGGCQGCPYRGRGYGHGGGMMVPGYGRYHKWDEKGEWKPRWKEGERSEPGKKDSSYSSDRSDVLSESDAFDVVRDFLKSTRDLNLKIGALTDAGDAYMVEILTRSGSVFDRVLVDKQNGYMRPVQ
jgi:hypothetical protein